MQEIEDLNLTGCPPSDLLACGLLSLVLAENFLKSSPKCLLACVSSGNHWKNQNLGLQST